VFASYSHQDEAAVLQWARGAQMAGVNVFMDVLSLRTGSDWKKELEQAINSHDIFCLFWSKSARLCP
jgi:hypothetical protein